MKKILQFLALAMLFAMIGSSITASNSPQLSLALINSAVPQGSPTITNNSKTPPNAAAITFYDQNKNAITLPTTIWFNGEYVMIPQNAAFIDVAYTASNTNHTIINVMNMQPITSSDNYSLTNPNSNTQPNDSPASWVLALRHTHKVIIKN